MPTTANIPNSGQLEASRMCGGANELVNMMMRHIIAGQLDLVAGSAASTNGGSDLLLHLQTTRHHARADHASQVVHNVLRLAEVDLFKSVAQLDLHVFHHPSHVRNVGICIVHREVLLVLSR